MKTIGKVSDSEKMDVAIAVCEQLGIDPDLDTNLWTVINYIDFDGLRNEVFEEQS